MLSPRALPAAHFDRNKITSYVGDRTLVAEVDMLDEHDLAVIVFDNVVAVQPIAVLIKIIDAFGTRVAFDTQARLPDFRGFKTFGVIDRDRHNVNRVIGP